MNLNDKKSKSALNLAGTVCFFVLFAAAAVFLIWKSRFGFGNCDEAFYLATPLRLFQGDALFLDEWHLSQTSSVLLLPFVSLYMAVFKSTEGIIMAFRFLYLALHGMFSVLIFLMLRKTNIIGACVSSLVFFIYAPFSINALSYNSMGIGCLALSCVLLYSSDGKSKIKRIFSGVFYAFSVLCCPYLVILFAVYTLATVIYTLIPKNKKSVCGDFLGVNAWLWFFIAVAVTAAVFIAFVLSCASVSDIISAVPKILSDPEHVSLGIAKKWELYYNSIVKLTQNTTPIIYLIFSLLFLVCVFDRNRKKNRAAYLFAFSIIVLPLFLIVNKEMKFINLTVFPLNLLALGCIPLFRDNKAIKKLFCTVWIPGIIYSFCIHLSSNQLYLAISSASVVSLVGSIAIIAEVYMTVIRETEKPSKILAGIVMTTVFAFQFVFLISFRYSEVFWEEGLEPLTERIEYGVEKGVYTSAYKKSEYDKINAVKDYVDKNHADKKSVLFFSTYTWPYLIFDNYENGAYSAWLSGVSDNSFERLKAYYELNPEKLPKLVYIEKKNIGYSEKFIFEYGYTAETLETGDVLLIK